jgi:hypothetical protein
VSAHLQDDHILVLTGRELVKAAAIFDHYIREQTRLTGAAPDLWFAPLARRGANVTKAMFGDETTKRTLEVEAAESAPAGDQSQVMTAVEAAKELGITEQHCRKIRHKIGVQPGKQITFHRDDLIAYKPRLRQRKKGK